LLKRLKPIGLESEYRFVGEGRWHLFVLPERWNRGLWTEVMSSVCHAPPTRHPQTRQFRYPLGNDGAEFYLKIYHRSPVPGTVKDLLRSSKALRALRQGQALSSAGFHVPVAVAAGEERSCRFLRKAFLLTLGIQGTPLPLFLRDHYLPPLGPDALRKKREHLRQLALEVRRLHRCGFVHGDLVPSNILVQRQREGVVFFYIDNDRTRRYPGWLPQSLWKRNLVQLNRFVLPGISLQDRMRFLSFYLGAGPWGRRERRLARWLERKTRTRRRECDRIEAPVSFRELMRWNGPCAKDLQ